MTPSHYLSGSQGDGVSRQILARTAIVGVFGLWAVVNGVTYALDPAKRYRGESAWFLFAIVLVAFAVASLISLQGAVIEERRRQRLPVLIVLVMGAFALLLYWPVTSIGLLSDDFALLGRARVGNLVDPSWEFARPLPLALWRLVDSLVGDQQSATALHLCNIFIHGANALLAAIVASRVGFPSSQSMGVAVLFFVFPGAVEPVAWLSGIFDLMATFCTLVACIVATGNWRPTAKIFATGVLGACALASKESSVVLPFVILVTGYLIRVNLRDVLVPVLAATVIVAMYLLIRFAWGFALSPTGAEVSGYAVKELLSRPMGFLAVPLHADVMQAQRWMPVMLAVFWPVAFAGAALRWREFPEEARLSVGLVVWILLTVAPLLFMMFIGEDLQGARYLYAGGVPWALLTMLVVRFLPTRVRLVALIPIIILYVVALRAHQSPWIAAGQERDRVVLAFRQARLNCARATIAGLPDNVRGAYVFRNGFSDAILTATQAQTSATNTCTVRWDGHKFVQD